ncbi:MAG: hypothetical protein AVDCRST_MAG89-1076, partial [uncultured Gemmatimonadetes bacterium]
RVRRQLPVRRQGPAARDSHQREPRLRVRPEAHRDDQHAGDRHDGLPGNQVPDAL